MTEKTISSMELLTLLNKTNSCFHNLSLAEYALLGRIIAHANTEDGHGYKCWPSTETLAELTGMHPSTIEKVRSSLVKGGWMTYAQGKGKGNSNTYYVNGFKIVEVYMQSGYARPKGAIAITEVQDKKTNKKEAKNKENLKRGKEKPVASEQPKKEIVVEEPPKPVERKNGYPKCLPWGDWVENEQQEVEARERKRKEDINNSDECPF